MDDEGQTPDVDPEIGHDAIGLWLISNAASSECINGDWPALAPGYFLHVPIIFGGF
jgi:hypothetical protein